MSDVASEPRVLVRWQLGRDLAAFRKDAGLRQDQVSSRLDWNSAKISRIENGDIGVQTSDLRALLDLYGHKDAESRAQLEDQARISRSRYKRNGNEHLIRGRYLTYEDAASVITTWEPYAVPGLLQTEDYLRARISAVHPNADEGEVQQRAQLRLTRQKRLQTGALRLSAVLDEAVLLHIVGSESIMKGQLDHLIHMSSNRNVTIQVLPLAQAAHPLMGGSATHMRFGDHAFELVYFEGNPSDYYETSSAQVRGYCDDLTTVRGQALSPSSSAKRIKEVLKQFD